MENLLIEKIKRLPTCDSLLERENAIKEEAEKLILVGLNRTNFFQHTFLYGSNYEKFFNGVNKTISDLQFIFYDASLGFNFENCLKIAVEELNSWGFNAAIDKRLRSITSTNQTLYIRFPLKQIYEEIWGPSPLISTKQTQIIKCEVITITSNYWDLTYRYITFPQHSIIKTIDDSSAYTLAIRNILFSKWHTRVDSNDLFDFIKYSELETPINYELLSSELKKYGSEFPRLRRFDLVYVKKILKARFEEIDFDYAYRDIISKVKDISLDIKWDKYLFITVLNNINR